MKGSAGGVGAAGAAMPGSENPAGGAPTGAEAAGISTLPATDGEESTCGI